jgi:pectate lyase
MYIENIDHFVDEEKVEDTNEVARSHRSKDSQHNGQMKKDKQRIWVDKCGFMNGDMPFSFSSHHS